MFAGALGVVLGSASARAEEPLAPPCAGTVLVDGHSGTVVCAPGVAPRQPAVAPEPLPEARPLVIAVDPPAFESGEIPNAPAAIARMKREIEWCTNAAPRNASTTTAMGSARRDADATLAAKRNRATPRPSSASGVGEPAELGTSAPEAAGERPTSSRPLPSALRLTFLVRAPGRAEGVAITPTGVASRELLRCASAAVSGRFVGTPTSDAVGVVVTFRLRESKKQ